MYVPEIPASCIPTLALFLNEWKSSLSSVAPLIPISVRKLCEVINTLSDVAIGKLANYIDFLRYVRTFSVSRPRYLFVIRSHMAAASLRRSDISASSKATSMEPADEESTQVTAAPGIKPASCNRLRNLSSAVNRTTTPFCPLSNTDSGFGNIT